MDFDDFEDALSEKLARSKKVAIIGVGADLREDDAIGNLLARDLVRAFQEKLKALGIDWLAFSDDEYVIANDWMILNASVVPEQYITLLEDFNPDCVFIVDAAQMGAAANPGDIAFIEKDELDKVSFSTHTLSLRHFIEILQTLGSSAEFIIGGVQPKLLDYGEELSPEVEQTRIFLRKFIIHFISDQFLDGGGLIA